MLQDQAKSYRNGELLASSDIVANWHLGAGVFETFIALQDRAGWKIPFGDRHVNRVLRSVDLIGLNAELVRPAIKTLALALGDYRQTQVRVRLIFTQQDYQVDIEPWIPRWREDQSISLKSIEGVRPLAEIKHCSSILSVQASAKARAAGADEALFISTQGELLEGAWSNFFWIDSEGKLRTADRNVLKGVTRSVVLDIAEGLGIEREVGLSSLNDFKQAAREAFITQATNGIVCVQKLDQILFAPEFGEVSARIKKGYQEKRAQQLVDINTLPDLLDGSS